ncbi:unnamed protein product [Victoria cruziana]
MASGDTGRRQAAGLIAWAAGTTGARRRGERSDKLACSMGSNIDKRTVSAKGRGRRRNRQREVEKRRRR